jgi:hypothetical protein
MVKHHQFPDIATQVLDKLGKEGMSSEESDGECGTSDRIYRIKRLDWRSPELTEWLRRLDGMPTKNKNDAVLARMAFYRTRITSDLHSTSRPAVPRLPNGFYRAEWVRALGPTSLRDVSITKASVTLPRIDDFTPVSTLD